MYQRALRISEQSVRADHPSTDTIARQLLLQVSDEPIARMDNLSHPESIHTVYRATTTQGNRLIIKLTPDIRALKDFNKSAWCQDQVRRKGIPAPKNLAIGTDTSIAYIVQENLEGIPIMYLPGENLDTWEQIGRYLAYINTIPTKKLGREFHTTEASETWKQYLYKELQANEAFSLYQDFGLLTAQQVKMAERIVAIMETWDFSPTLAHNNIYRNTLVTPDWKVSGFIDWEQALSTYAPFGDVAYIAPFLTPRQYKAFLRGYGINAYDFGIIRPYIEISSLLLHAQSIEASIQAQNTPMIELVKKAIACSSLVQSQKASIYSIEDIERRKRFYFCHSIEFVLGKQYGNCAGTFTDTGERINLEEYLSIHFRPNVQVEEAIPASNRKESFNYIRTFLSDILRTFDILRENKEFSGIEWIIGVTNPRMVRVAENLGFRRLANEKAILDKNEELITVAILKNDFLSNEERIRKVLRE